MGMSSPAQPFVHLHLHSDYSLLDSSIPVKKAVKQAAKLGMPALALTDHAVLHGAITFYNACKSEGIKPIVGCEMYVCKDRHEKSRQAGPNHHLLLLAKDIEGYHNLARLSSIAHLEGFYYKPRVDFDLLARHSAGLIATSCCERGEIPSLLLNGIHAQAEQLAGRYRDLYGPDNFFLELEDHGKDSEKKICQELLGLSKRLDIPLVATNDVHYLDRAHAEAHDLLLCLQGQSKFRDERRLRFATDQYYFKTQAEMWALFGEVPDALHNTLEIADRCALHLKLEKEAPLHFPTYPLPDGFDLNGYLRHVSVEGIKRRYNGADIDHPRTELEHTLRERFDKEFGVIQKTGYINYFLVVWDFIHWAKQNSIPVGPGRGSGAGSLVAYVMGITDIDPLRFDLIFERFLNPDRVSPPDFDVDFCQTRRGEVIEYVKRKYGPENCAQIATFGTLGAKTIIRDLGRVLEIPLAYCDKLAKMVPEDPNMTLEKAEQENPEFKQAVKTEPEAQTILRYARVLEGLHRNQGTHAAGVVIGETVLMDIVPLCRDKDGQAVAQYEMKPLEMTGLLKMDFLGLKTLSVIQEAVRNVKLTQNIDIDISALPLDDKETFALLGRGDTVAVFQVESSGMRDMLKQFQADSIEEIIALIALYRPGPMEMIPGYIECKHGRKQIHYPHPLLEPVLKETYGVFIYQEQVQRAANVLAGFTLAQGDLLRRAMGKKDAAIMVEQRAKFVEGCGRVNQISAKQAGEIFDLIEKFASYGFNKSHSAAYAFLTFQTAYMKAHHPAEFMAAVLTLEIGNSEKLMGFIGECKEMGMKVLPPDVQLSAATFRPEGADIRFGLAGIKGVGSAAVDLLVAEREANGPFLGFMDFCSRVNSRDLNKRCLESLIKAGAFDWTGLPRRRMFEGMDFSLQRAEARRADLAQGQTSLFDLLDDAGSSGGAGDLSDADLPEVEPWSSSEMLSFEKDLLGFYISGHPLEEFEWEIDTYASHPLPELATLPEGTLVRVAGLVTEWRKFFTKNETEMATFKLEGLRGGIQCAMYQETVQQYASGLHDNLPVMLAAELKPREGEPRLIIHEICPLAKAPAWYAERVTLHLSEAQTTEKRLSDLRDLVQQHPGSTPLHFCVNFPTGERVFLRADGAFGVHAGHGLLHGMTHIFGEGSVFVQSLQDPCKFPRRSANRFPPRRAGN